MLLGFSIHQIDRKKKKKKKKKKGEKEKVGKSGSGYMLVILCPYQDLHVDFLAVNSVEV